jgi:hypothetical protein
MFAKQKPFTVQIFRELDNIAEITVWLKRNIVISLRPDICPAIINLD